MNIAATAAGKARASLGPNANAIRSRVPRISNMGVGGTVYQRFALPGGLPGGGRRFLESIDEKPVVGGFAGLTEKDIEEKASFCFNLESTRPSRVLQEPSALDIYLHMALMPRVMSWWWIECLHRFL